MMRHNFDADRAKRAAEAEQDAEDRSFQFGGKLLRYLANPPYTATKNIVEVTEGDANLRVFSVVEGAVLAMLEPGSRDAFREAVTNDGDPVTWLDLVDLAYWLIGAAAGRPPTRPVSSTDGSSPTGTTLTENSSLEPVVA